MLKKWLIRSFVAVSVLVVAFFVSCSVTDESLTDEGIVAKIVGSWKVAETVGTTSTHYSVSVTSSGSVNVTISNFYNVDLSVKATVSEGSLIIPEQIVGGYTIKGTGIFSNSYSTITLNYTTDDGSGKESVTDILTR